MCESKIIELSLNFCPDLATYLDLVAKKTGLLFSLSCYIGSKLAQGDESIAKNFGLNFGLAYQIIDDCLDFISKEEKIGKDTNVDSRLNRNSNLILLYLKKEKLSLEDSIQKAYELAKEKLDCAYSYLSSFQASAYKDKLETLGDYILNMLNR
jgi:octaprenyl-diphosphate synthase